MKKLYWKLLEKRNEKKKVLILGNSHVRSLKLALDELPETFLIDNGLEIDFLANKGNSLIPVLEVKQGVITSTSEETVNFISSIAGTDYITLNEYQILVMYGPQLMTKGCGLNWIRHVKDYVSNKFSESAIELSHVDSVIASSHYQFLTDILADDQFEGKFISIPCPLPSELHPDLIDKTYVTKGFLDRVESIYKDVIENNISKAEFIKLPKSLRAENQYSTSKRYKMSRQEDVTHLNVEGGCIVRDALLKALLST